MVLLKVEPGSRHEAEADAVGRGAPRVPEQALLRARRQAAMGRPHGRDEGRSLTRHGRGQPVVVVGAVDKKWRVL
jgi:hypothetical protein